jgi:hypothetical protein
MRISGVILPITFLVSACLVSFSVVWPIEDPAEAGETASPRDSLKVPTKKYFEQILVPSQNGDFKAIDPVVEEIKPVLDYLNEKYHYDAESAIRDASGRKDANLVRSAVQGAVYRDLLSLLDEAAAQSREDQRSARIDIRIARLTYEIVSPNVRKGDLARDERIKKKLVDAYRLASASSPYAREGQTDNGQLISLLNQISLEIKGVTPGD